MYYRVERRFNLLHIEDTFASLKSIKEDGNLEFEFRYVVSQSDSIIRGAVTVDVSVFTRTVKKRPILGVNQIGKIDSRELIGNILSDMPAAKSALKSQENYVLSTRKSDISAAINNESITQIKAGVQIKNISSMYSSRLKSVTAGSLQEANDNKPVLDNLDLKVNNVYNSISASLDEKPQSLAHDLILKRGIDPSAVNDITSKMMHSYESFHGTLRPSIRFEPDHGTLSRLHNQLTQHPGLLDRSMFATDVEEHKLMDVVVTEPIDNVEIPVRMVFKPPSKKAGSRDSSSVFVKFQLLDSKTGTALDTVIKPLDVPTHIRIFNTPISAPIVKSTRAEISSRVNLLITQTDSRANEVHVYKKNIYTSVTDVDDYTLIGIYPVTGSQHALVQVDMPVYNAAIYRVIPAFSGMLGFSYSNVVVNPKKYRPIRAVSLTAKIVDNGISIEARKLPPNATSIQFLQRNLTIFQKKFDPIGSPQLIDDVARQSDHLSITTLDVQDNNIYEFAVMLYHKSGTQELTANEIIEYVIATPGKVDIKVTDITVNHDSAPNVTFNVNLSVLDSNLDAIKKLMENQGIKSYFEDDIATQRDQLKSLLAYSLHRVDLTTGEREDFGVITQSEFNDSDVRKNYATRALRYGHRYRYVITAVSRTSETVLESFQKKITDDVTKKQYMFKPSKFLHPLTLRRGLLISPNGLKTRYSKSTFEHGTLGSTTSVEISFDDNPIRVVESSASQFNKYLNLVSWRVDGPVEKLDHFVIMKEVHGIRVMLGTAHSSFDHGNCQWIHNLTPHDRGEIKYVIVPVLNDYNQGQSVITNSLLIEEL